MQARPLEKPRAVPRGDRHLEGAAVAIDQQWHIDAGIAERPDLAERSCKLAHLAARARENDAAVADAARLRGPARRETDHHDLVLDLGRVEPEPGARRPV